MRASKLPNYMRQVISFVYLKKKTATFIDNEEDRADLLLKTLYLAGRDNPMLSGNYKILK